MREIVAFGILAIVGVCAVAFVVLVVKLWQNIRLIEKHQELISELHRRWVRKESDDEV